MIAKPLRVAVILGDPRLPYPYAIDGKFGEVEMQILADFKAALNALDGYEFRFLDDHARMIDELRNDKPDLALNLCDTGFNNNWELERDVPALLEILDIPYTGADPMAISLTTDKSLVRAIAQLLGVPVPNEVFVDLTAEPLVLPEIYPSLIKPNSSGGSFGITAESVVQDAAAADAYLRWLRPLVMIQEAVIQDFLTGPEYTVGIVGNLADAFTVLPPLMVDYSKLDPDLPPLQTYDSKADPDSPYYDTLDWQRAELDDITQAQLIDHSVRLYRRFNLRDYARIDWRAGDDGHPRLLEVNTNPDCSNGSKMCLMAGWAGHSYPEFLGMIMQAAARRAGVVDA